MKRLILSSAVVLGTWPFFAFLYADAETSLHDRAAAQAYLDEFPGLTIPIATGPGFGPTSAALDIVNSLRDLDYQGQIHLSIPPEARYKFDRISQGHAHLLSLSLPINQGIPGEGISSHRLMITGAGNHHLFEPAGVQSVVLRLSPVGWMSRESIEVLGDPPKQWVKPIETYDNESYALVDSTHPHPADAYFTPIPSGSHYHPRLKPDEIKLILENNRFLRGTVYGVRGAAGIDPLLKYLEGLSSWHPPENFGHRERTKVLLIFGDFQLREQFRMQSAYSAYSGGKLFIVPAKVSQYEQTPLLPPLDKVIGLMAPGDTLALLFPEAPQGLFLESIRKSLLPTLVAGTGAVQQLRNLGLPHLLTIFKAHGIQDNERTTVETPGSDRTKQMILQASRFIQSSGGTLHDLHEILNESVMASSPLRSDLAQTAQILRGRSRLVRGLNQLRLTEWFGPPALKCALALARQGRGGS